MVCRDRAGGISGFHVRRSAFRSFHRLPRSTSPAGLPGRCGNFISISIGPFELRLLASPKPRLPPSLDRAILTFVFMASRRNPKIENSVDLPVPFAPTKMARRGTSLILHVFEGAKISYPDPLDPHQPIPRLRGSWWERSAPHPGRKPSRSWTTFTSRRRPALTASRVLLEQGWLIRHDEVCSPRPRIRRWLRTTPRRRHPRPHRLHFLLRAARSRVHPSSPVRHAVISDRTWAS